MAFYTGEEEEKIGKEDGREGKEEKKGKADSHPKFSQHIFFFIFSPTNYNSSKLLL